MGRALEQRLATRRFEGPHHEAVLNVMLAANHLRERTDDLFTGAGVTAAQYNVLRILNGRHPEGYSRGEIARRVLDHAPDLTRMLDRLVRAGLVQRARSSDDARRSLARITPKGRALLAQLHGRVRAQHKAVEARLSTREARELSRLCEKLWQPDRARRRAGETR
ncbi:MAG TPA: MarR family transcriptional regulator [Candidatus Acidoferrales bacterium]|nr:MarR family transcriptional regulator [Candidatus Acidoferrales bacterium]